jgi:plasmid maintenance system antidote protein VapI
MSNAAAATSVEMAAVTQRSSLLNTALADIGQQVALGTLTVEQGADAYQQYEATLADVGTQAPKTGVNLAGLTTKIFAVGAAFTAVTLAARKGLEAIKSGAELELTIQRFDRLAETIGTTGDALTGDLIVASRGLVSQFEAMALATDFMALGLVKTHDEAVRLSNVASQLGFDMNQLVLTLTNQTTMRFDALGVSVAGFSKKVEALEDAGHDANEAFQLAFLEQAEEQIERVGSVAETTAGKISIIESAWKDLLDTLKLGTIDALGPFIDELASATIAGSDAARAASEFSKAAGDQDEQIAAVGELRSALEDLDNFLGVGVGLFSGVALDRATDSFLALAGEAAAAGTTIEEQQQILRDLGFEVENGVVALGGYAVAWERVAEAINSVRIESVIGDVTNAVNLALDPLGDVAAASAEALGDLQKQVEAIEFKELLVDVGLTKDEFIKLAAAMGGTAEATEFLKIQAAGVPGLLRDIANITDELGEQLAEQLEGRADLFIDFQDELTQISFTEAERRSDVEASSEERRTEIVERHGERRARDEQDWARSRLRQQAGR